MSANQVAFFFASLAMVLSPGANFVLITTTHLVEGPRRGSAVAAGMVLGGLAIAVGTLVLLPMLGGDAPWVRAAVSMLGGAYLGWLGASGIAVSVSASRTLRTAEGESTRAGEAVSGALIRGVVSSLTNPGLYVIYLVLLPAHIVADTPWRREAALLAAMHLGLAAAWFVVLGGILHRARHLVSSDRAQWMVRLVGSGVLLVLGVWMIVRR